MQRSTRARPDKPRDPGNRRWSRSLIVAIAATGLLGSAVTASAQSPPVSEAVETFEWSDNMTPIGFSERVPANNSDFNSDLAFQGDLVFQGTYNGFRVLDVSDPTDPEVVGGVHDTCLGAQGDVIVFEDVLVRSWDGSGSPGGTCVGVPAATGLQVFDISDVTDPVAVASVNLPCGSHTASGVPDLDNDRLLVYNNPQSGGCNGIDVVEVPLDDPSAANTLRFVPSGDPQAQFPNEVTVDDGPAEGTYAASGAAFGMAPDLDGVSGDIVVVDAGGANPTQGCDDLIDFPEGAIALADRGGCPFLEITRNAQNAGASAVIVANNTGGNPINMGGDDPDHEIMISAVMVSQADGNTIKDGLPASGSVSAVDAGEFGPPRACHDTGVILGDVMRAACAGHDGVTVFSLDEADGASLEDPQIIWTRSFPGISIGHSAAWTFDGEVLVFGHEPGGGGQAQCQETSSDLNRTLFFLDGATGETLSEMIHPRPQTAQENCTWHNYNVVPTDKHYTLVSGNYQSGIIVVNFSDPTDPKMVAFADPAPLVPTQLGGDWSTYWYDGLIFESDIRRGLIIWELDSPYVAGAKSQPHLNPQTQEESFGKSPAFGRPGGDVTGPPSWLGDGPGKGKN